MRALFLTWDGNQQSYLESLFLPIFVRLREAGVEVHVLQFTWATEQEREPTRRAASAAGIPYTSQRISRRLGLPGQMAAIASGARLARRYARQHGIRVLFPRSLMPASMALLAARFMPEARIVFDADGLMADERVDFAGWSARGLPYRVLRDVEAETLRVATSVITRTQAAKGILAARAGAATDTAKIFVVPNAKDEQAFQPGTAESRALTRARFGVPTDAPWLVYAGSLGPQYEPEALLDFFAKVRQRSPDARLLFFTFQQQAFEALLQSRGLPRDAIEARQAEPREVAATLAAADLGLALRRESFSQQAICPIKVAEYLQCGVPVLSSRVGDLSEQIGSNDVAFLLSRTSADELERAASWFLETVVPQRQAFRERCRRVGVEIFGIERCAEAYLKVFERSGGGLS